MRYKQPATLCVVAPTPTPHLPPTARSIYRFFGVGSLEEVCYERQVAKEGLAAGVVDGDQEYPVRGLKSTRLAPLPDSPSPRSILALALSSL